MTSYGLDDLGFEPRCGEDLPIETGRRGPPILLYNGYRVSFAGIKRPGRGPNHTPLQDPGFNISRAIKLVPLPPTCACWHVTGQLNLIIPVERCRAYSTTFPFSFRLKYLRNISMHVSSSAPAEEYRNASCCWLNDSVPRFMSHNLYITGKPPLRLRARLSLETMGTTKRHSITSQNISTLRSTKHSK